ncbi:hypothetical protein BDW69DRAFT_198739 [Aspergillus filifer]
MTTPFVAVAGATGALGRLVALEHRNLNTHVKALVRPGTEPSRVAELQKSGVTITPVKLSDVETQTTELQGATCVMSVLQGSRRDAWSARQSVGRSSCSKVPRFLPSDFSLDLAKTEPGSNRNLDLRRDILNGGFMDLLGGDTPLLNHYWRRIPYVGSADQLLDFTTMKDVAIYTAAVALDTGPTPKILRIAGDVVSMRGVAEAASEVEEQRVQYMELIFPGDGKLEPLDKGRYPGVKWTGVVDFLRQSKEEQSDN